MISITVKTIDSASHSVSCLENATLLELKKAIEVSLNVPANNQRLIHAGKLLAPDTENIANFGLSHGKVIHLVTRLAGVANDQPPQRSTGRPVSRDPRPTPHLTYSIRSITADGNMELSGEHFSQLMRTYMTNNGPTHRTSTSANPPPTGTTVVSPTTSTSAPVQANTTGSTLPIPSEDPTVYVVGNGMSSSLLFNHRSRRRNSRRTSNSNTGNAEVRTANNNVIFTRAVPLARLRGQVRTTTPQLQLARASSLIRSIELLLELPTTAPLDASISLPSISEPSQEILNQFDPERTNYSQSLARIIDQMTNLERRVGDAMRWLTGSIRGEVWCADNVSRTSLQRASLLSANISYRLSQLHLILFPLMANLRFENTQPGSADIVIPPPELPRRLAARASSRANPTVGAQEEGTSLLSHVDEIMFQTTFINDPRGATEPSNSTDVNGRADGDGEEGNAMEMAFQSYLNDLAGMPGLTPSGGTQTETRQMSNPSVAHQADTTSNANQGTVNQRSPGVQERYTITMYPEIQLIPIDMQAIANLPSIVRFPGMVVSPSALFGNRSRRTGSATNANVSVTGDNSTPVVGSTGPSASHNARRSDQLSPPSNEQPSSAQPSSATATRNTTPAAGPRRLSGFPTFIADMFRSAFTGSASANDTTDTQSHSTSGNVVPSVTTTHVPTMMLNPQSPQQHSTTTPQHRPNLNNNNNSTTTSTTTTTTANRGLSRHVQSPRSPSTNQERASAMTTARSDTHHGEDLGSVDQFSSVIEHLGTLLSGVLRIVDHSGVDNLRTLADVLLSGSEPSDLERGTTSHLLRQIAQSLTIRDLQRIADGDLAPLQPIQGVINSWIRDDFLRSEPLSEENINQTAEYLAVAFVNSGDMHEMPMRRTPHSTVSTADIYAMTLNVSRDYFKSLVNLVVATHPGPPSTFAPELTIWLRDILEAWRTEFFALFGDDHVEARRVGRHVVAWFLTCNSAPLHDLMYEAALHLLSFLSSNILLPDPGTDGAVWAANRTGISEMNLQSSSSAPSTSTHSVGATTSDSNIRVRARQESDDPLNARKKRKPTDGETLPEDDPES